MTNFEQIIDLERRYLLQTYNRYPVAFERGKGVFLFDFEGKKYLDFVSGLGVNALGPRAPAHREDHSRPSRPPDPHLESLLPRISGKLAEKLVQLSGLDRVFFSNSGTEAIEGSIKLARLASHRDRWVERRAA